MEKIFQIRNLVNNHKIRWTSHTLLRMIQRKITREDIITAILNGEIIEEYNEDYPYPSYLIFGYNLQNIVIHIVCGCSDDELWIITAYYPSNNDWNSDLKTRKEK